MQTLTQTTREILLGNYDESVSELKKMVFRLEKTSEHHEFYQALIVDIFLQEQKIENIKDMLIKGQFEF